MLVLCAFFALWVGSARAVPVPPFIGDDDATTALSGPLDMRDASGGTN